jgi:hypothetical protein
MTDDTPNRPAPLTDKELEALLGEATTCPSGQAVQGKWLQSLVLKRWFSDVDREELLEARAEAPDEGMEASQRALDEMPPEQRIELLDRAQMLYRMACAEAIAQLERVMLGLWEDPRKIIPDDVAIVAGTPIISRGERLLGELDG